MQTKSTQLSNNVNDAAVFLEKLIFHQNRIQLTKKMFKHLSIKLLNDISTQLDY